ncbi:hypothetical protein P171DRAFT_373490 [Karstenula rhodostoma CBS 690.94]|uniref:Rhodopsin domain-containing protein n=1 Tax=Karstenula rhodostoma CBS 690.94 TaxID=1392251 RepID=A0A9P4P2Z1_9PLEO|nr:hypothetical protein P171DRAFT_373490 [Karstenula rhodostoma CBS 690.94]
MGSTAPSQEYLAEDYGPTLLAIDCTLFGLATITMILRIYVRVFMLKMFGIDDWLMLIAVALSVTTTGLFIKVITIGLGRHFDPSGLAFPLANIQDFFKYTYVYAILIIFAYSFIKLSIGFFLLRLADRTRWRTFLIATLVFLVAFTIGSTMAIVFQCIPVRAAYDLSLKPPQGNAKCYPIAIFKNIGVFNSSVNIATDLLFALLPIPIVWKLQVTIQTKLGLSFCMALGLLATATAIYKTPMQYHFFEQMDFTGNGSWYYIWQQVEMNVGIIAANLPTLKPLVARFFTSLRTIAGSYGSRAGRSTLATPYKSTGYMKHGEGQSFAMSSLSKKSTADKEWGKRGESDESILREHGGGFEIRREREPARRESIRNGGILRTTDVVITRFEEKE